MIVDCDPGLDDALALLMLAAARHRGTISIGCVVAVAGNASVDKTAANAAQVMAAAGAGDVPVISGAASPLGAGGGAPAASIHGPDGLGGLADGRTREMLAAADPGRELAARIAACPPPVWLLCSGPLTDLALAIRSDETAVRSLERIVVMGGAFGDPSGNITPWAEFNFHADAAAAGLACGAGLPLEIVPLDITHRLALDEKDDHGLAPFAAALLGRSRDLYRSALGQSEVFVHDAVAAALLLDPSLGRRRPGRFDVTTAGERAGQVVAHPVPVAGGRGPTVVEHMDASRTRGLIRSLLVEQAPEAG